MNRSFKLWWQQERLLQTGLKEEDNEEIEEANAKEISVDAIVAAVLAELDGMFALKEGQR